MGSPLLWYTIILPRVKRKGSTKGKAGVSTDTPAFSMNYGQLAAAATIVVAATVVVAAAGEEYNQQDDDPAAVVTAEEVISAHSLLPPFIAFTIILC